MADSTAHGSNRRRKLSRASTSYRYCEHANQTSLAVYNDDGVSNTASASSSVADTAPLPPTMDNPPLASLTMTHVHYDPSSRISYACAWLALVPQALCITYASLIWSTREIEILVMFAGQLGCEGLNWLLKRWIREERPTQMLGKGYGMPSSHAQFAAYFAVYLGLWVLVRHDPWAKNESKTHVPTPLWQRAGLAAAGLAGAVVVAQSRIMLNYHTPRQVYTGFAVGAGCAVAWFVATGMARHLGVFDWVLDLAPMRWLRMRDLLLNEDLVDAGWERWELRRQKRAAKSNQASFSMPKKSK